MIVDKFVVDNFNLKEKNEFVFFFVVSLLEKVNIEVLVLKSKLENILKVENEKFIDVVVKFLLKIVKNISLKFLLVEKIDFGILLNFKKDKIQELLFKENIVEKVKESKELRNIKGIIQKGNEKVLSKVVDFESKVEIFVNKELKLLFIEFKLKIESEEKMDFDQLSIEDEDSDFEEEEEEEEN